MDAQISTLTGKPLECYECFGREQELHAGFPWSEIFNAVDPRKNLDVGQMKMFEVGMCI